MITISGRLFGLLSLGTAHVKIGVDLPPFAYSVKLGIIELTLTTGPRLMGVPSHSVQMVEVGPNEVLNHEEADPRIAAFVAGWD